VDVGDLVGRAVPVHRRLDEGVVQVEDALLRGAVPAPRVLLIRRVVLGVGAERREEGRLVIGRPAHPPVGQARPGGDRVARGDQIGGAHRSPEVSVRVTPRAGIGAARQQGVLARLYDALHAPATHTLLTCGTDTGSGSYTHRYFR